MKITKLFIFLFILISSTSVIASDFRTLALKMHESDLANCMAGTAAMLGLASGIGDNAMIKQYTNMFGGVTKVFNKVIAIKGSASKSITTNLFNASVKAYKSLPYNRKLPYAQDKIKSCEKFNELARKL